jgi:hypothetical protein
MTKNQPASTHGIPTKLLTIALAFAGIASLHAQSGPPATPKAPVSANTKTAPATGRDNSKASPAPTAERDLWPALSAQEERDVANHAEDLALMLIVGNMAFPDEFKKYRDSLNTDPKKDTKMDKLFYDMNHFAGEVVWFDRKLKQYQLRFWKVESSCALSAFEEAPRLKTDLAQAIIEVEKRVNQKSPVIPNDYAYVPMCDREIFVADFNHRADYLSISGRAKLLPSGEIKFFPLKQEAAPAPTPAAPKR